MIEQNYCLCFCIFMVKCESNWYKTVFRFLIKSSIVVNKEIETAKMWVQYESAQLVVSVRQKLLFTLTVADLRIKICHGLHLHFFVIKNVSLDFM